LKQYLEAGKALKRIIIFIKKRCYIYVNIFIYRKYASKYLYMMKIEIFGNDFHNST